MVAAIISAASPQLVDGDVNGLQVLAFCQVG